jgi:hypothetical protein
MGNCHFKTDFEAEQMAGSIFLYPFRNLTSYLCSSNQSQLLIPVLHWQRGLRKSVESREKENKVGVCHERNV